MGLLSAYIHLSSPDTLHATFWKMEHHQIILMSPLYQLWNSTKFQNSYQSRYVIKYHSGVCCAQSQEQQILNTFRSVILKIAKNFCDPLFTDELFIYLLVNNGFISPLTYSVNRLLHLSFNPKIKWKIGLHPWIN